MDDIWRAIQIWLSVVSSPPQSWLWATLIPGFIRKLRRFTRVPYIGALAGKLLDSPWAHRVEKASRAILVAFVLVALAASPFMLIAQQKKEFVERIDRLQSSNAALEAERTVLKDQLVIAERQIQDLRVKVQILEARPSEIRIKQEKPDADRIGLAMQWAYEWNYRGSRNVAGETARDIDPAVPLRKRYSTSEERLQIGVSNGNSISLEDVILRAQFVDNVKVRPIGAWSEMIPNREYVAHIGTITDGIARGPVEGALFVRFPGPGRYRVNYIIKVKWLPVILRYIDVVLD